jgi:hypothetical protein
MSFFDDINAGMAEAVSTMGESFTMANHTGMFKGVFRGESAPVSFDDIQGFDKKTSDALTVSKALFTAGAPPMVDEIVTKSDGTEWTITMIESGDLSSWDLELTKRNG